MSAGKLQKPWSTAWKVQQLRVLRVQWESCEKCLLHNTRTQVVFGNGNVDADILLVGEGPGADEDANGNPFVGRSGQLLNTILEAAGILRSDVFVSNLVGCRPILTHEDGTIENREPTKLERLACWARICREIYVVDPLIVVPVGKTAMSTLIGREFKRITKDHGKLGWVRLPSWASQNVRGWRQHRISYPAIPIMHPSFIMRSDTQDPVTKKWSINGPAIRTLTDVKLIADVTHVMRSRYDAAQLELSRGE